MHLVTSLDRRISAAVALCLAALLASLPRPALAQESTVAGTVISSRTQEPVASARVEVAGSPMATTTDARGRFRLTSLTGAQVTLDIRVIGFRRATVPARVGDLTVRVLLEEQAVTLDEMVVTGTAGAAEKRTLGNAVGQIQAGFITQRAPIANVQNLLNSRVAGVVVLPGSGNLGTGGVTRIRGVASLSLSNEPLIYIDGVRASNDPAAGPNIRQGRQVSRINDINPEDIESIEIIKGPAAATLYGTEASSGVIQIITKRGVTGRPSVELTMKQGGTWLANPLSKVPTVYSRNAAGTLESVNLLQNELDAGRRVFQTGHNQAYAASVRGGTDQVRYFVSGDYGRGEGVVDYNTLRNASTRVNVNLTPSDKLDIATSIGFVTSRTRFAQAATGWGVWDQLVWGSPSRLPTRTRGFLRATPEVAAEIESVAKIGRFMGGIQANWRPLRWLSHRFNAGTDINDETNSILFPRNPQGSSYFFGALSLGQKTIERRRVQYYTVDYSASADLNLTSSIRSTTTGGLQYYTKRFEIVSATGQQFPDPSVKTVGGAAVTTGSEDIIENKTFGLFLQQQFGYKNRFFLTGAVRGDDNSAFGRNYDFVVYPKVSGSWVLSEEPFWGIKPVSTLKLRAAYGRAGQQPDVFAAIRLYQPSTGPGDVSVLTPLAVGNADLKPEQSQEIELGLDAGLWRDRVGIGFTYFRQRRTDAIVPQQAPPSAGFPGFRFVNLGEVTNRGVEFELNAQVLTGRQLGWDLGFKVSTASSNIVSLGGLPPIFVGFAQYHREGHPIAAYFERRIISAELDGAGRAINILCDPGPAGGGGVPCATAPRLFYGIPTPKWEGAVSSTFSVGGNLQLYALVDFRGGYLIQNTDIEAMHTAFRNSKAINERTDPILVAHDQLGNTFPTGFFNAGFAKLREVSATYTLPAGLARSFGASRASINVAARNVGYLWRAQRTIYGQAVPDPEVRTPGAELSGQVSSVLPPFTQLITTVRLTF
ncbi:MAG: SusC/RagA family TonB-linked outer membrane protein [Gemmatimonadales bacterium]